MPSPFSVDLQPAKHSADDDAMDGEAPGWQVQNEASQVHCPVAWQSDFSKYIKQSTLPAPDANTGAPSNLLALPSLLGIAFKTRRLLVHLPVHATESSSMKMAGAVQLMHWFALLLLPGALHLLQLE